MEELEIIKSGFLHQAVVSPIFHIFSGSVAIPLRLQMVLWKKIEHIESVRILLPGKSCISYVSEPYS